MAGTPTAGATGAVVLIPVKAFHRAKVRLSPALDGPHRARLARRMATRVVAAAHPLPAAVVCDDDEVAAWAGEVGARVIWTPGLGLDGAVLRAVEVVAAEGASRAVVAHGDLPLARDLSWLGGGRGVTLVPDRRGDGTNVASVPTAAGFRFAYGPGSFDRHQAEALRLGLPLHVVWVPSLGWDVDLPDDLDVPDGDVRRDVIRCR